MPLAVAVALVVGLLIGLFAGRNNVNNRLRESSFNSSAADNKLVRALSLIEHYYVDSVSMDSLVERVLPEVMWNLDPHSVYIPAEELTSLNEPLEGEFDGIGISFNMTTDTVIVLNVFPNGPSSKAGLQNGDRIINIGDSLVAGRKLSMNDIARMLRGPRGTEVTVEVLRQGISDLVPITITRDKIPIKSIDAVYMINPQTGFVRINTFSQNTHKEMMQALERLSKQGMKNLIIDLRGNSGGYLGQPILMANEFLPEGSLIVYTEDRNATQLKEFSDGRGKYLDLQLVVLMDEHSASSSEIFAGALQDNDRATIIGRRSFGKGLVQQQIPFDDGSAIRLTTARYFTPTGRSIQKPYSAADSTYELDIYNRYLHSELFSADSIRLADTVRYITPRGKVLYGGGGIMPDVFVPLDTVGMNNYYFEVMGRNIVYRFAMDYADRNRDRINNITTVEQLERFLDSDPNMMADFTSFAARNGVAPDANSSPRTRQLIRTIVRSYIARNSPLEETGFMATYNTIDNPVIEALKVFDEGSDVVSAVSVEVEK